MILEIATLKIVSGQESEFETAFRKAQRDILPAVPGLRGLELERCIEQPTRYALLVRWDTVEDHTVRFRGSAEYARWRELLHPFFDGPPEVVHFGRVSEM